MTITIGSLFSGIGGLELGLEQGLADMGLDAETIWQVERDKYASTILARHWPDAERFADVQSFSPAAMADAFEGDCGRWAEEPKRRPEGRAPSRGHGGRPGVGSVDLICGGFPCQDLSLAGRRAGLAGARSGLWWEFERIVRELEPRWVVAENVPGLLSADAGDGRRGSAMGAVVGSLAALGYGVWWDCIPAAAVGAPHRRDRVFIVARRAVADDNGQRCQSGAERHTTPREHRRGRLPRRCDDGRAEPRMGRTTARLPTGMDRAERAVDALAAHPWAGGGAMWPTAAASLHNLDENPEPWAERRERVKVEANNGNGFGLPLTMAPKLGDAPNRAPWERDVPRLTTDPTDRRDRLRCLGNAVVPQVARVVGQWIGAAMIEEVPA